MDFFSERVTDGKNTGEDWGAILDVCDKVKIVSNGAKDCLKAILKRLNNSDPHVALQAVTVLDACVQNCGKDFHLEVASREFESEFRKLVQKGHPKVSEKLRVLLKRWAAQEFSTDSQLSLIPSLFKSLKTEGYDFSLGSEAVKKTTVVSKDPNVVSTQQEEDDIAKAIELSLKESQKSSSTRGISTTSSSLYPSTSMLSSETQAAQPIVKKQARALYDFEAAEDNELTFLAGEIVNIIDDSDPNWWKGTNHRGEGLFPANFVTTNLDEEQEETPTVGTTSVEQGEVQLTQEEIQPVAIDEEKIDTLLRLLHDADPQGEVPDPPQLSNLEVQVNSMAPLIDAELDRIDRKHFALTKLNSELVESLNMYHNLMRESPFNSMYSPYQKPIGSVAPPQPSYYPSEQPTLPPPGVTYGSHHHPGYGPALLGTALPPGSEMSHPAYGMHSMGNEMHHHYPHNAGMPRSIEGPMLPPHQWPQASFPQPQ
ncbi:hypothetical protein QYM36_000345 [Artemia franciscana]|uniref:Signal transducing adapter molecule 1 n=1 Tax=Artemia franciscana TaxID=6661 RepID=A0AA88ICY0_ARTSF|nr:hypothetical protein QYM36_000345 [Artemia franciscana]